MNTEKINVAVRITRTVLGFLTNIKDSLPKCLRAPLQWGRDNGLWQRGQGPNIQGPKR